MSRDEVRELENLRKLHSFKKALDAAYMDLFITAEERDAAFAKYRRELEASEADA